MEFFIGANIFGPIIIVDNPLFILKFVTTPDLTLHLNDLNSVQKLRTDEKLKTYPYSNCRKKIGFVVFRSGGCEEFRGNMSPLFSESKNKPSKKPRYQAQPACSAVVSCLTYYVIRP
jgi:hypothetical protein